MITWLIIAVVALLVLVFFINSYQNKYQSFQGVVFNFAVVIVLVFLVFSVSYVYLKTKPDIGSLNGVTSFVKSYFVWFFGIFSNIKGIVGYVIGQDWAYGSGNMTR